MATTPNGKSEENVINNKKILCFNMLNNKKCNYGNKCVYAHGLSDQKIEPIRHKAYTIIKSVGDLSHIDLIADNKLYDTLIQLTKMCSLCNKELCPGGYNCRNGAINIKSKICYDDFMFGNCKRVNCLAVHLTIRGFIPYNKQKKPKVDNKVDNKEVIIKKKPKTVIVKGIKKKPVEVDSDMDDVDDKKNYFSYIESKSNELSHIL